MNKIEELNNNIIKEIKAILGSGRIIDENLLNRIIGDFVWIARNYNSRYKVEPYDLWYKGYDFLKLDLFKYMGFDSYFFRLDQNGDNLTLMFGQEAILAVRNVIFDRFSNEFMISCVEKFNLPPIRLDFVMSKNFIFGCNETFQNAGEISFITTIDYLESGQREKIEEFKYVYCKNEYSHTSVMIDRVNGLQMKSTSHGLEVFDFDTRYLDNKVDFPISGTVEERLAKLTKVRKAAHTDLIAKD